MFFISSLVMFAVGLPVGFVWTLIFAPMLDRVWPERRNWFAYAVEAVGVFLMSCVLWKIDRLSPLCLLGCMISAGTGMFIFKALEVKWKQCCSNWSGLRRNLP